MAKRKHVDHEGPTAQQHDKARHPKQRKLSKGGSASKADPPIDTHADETNIDSTLGSIEFDIGDPPPGLSANGRKRWRHKQRSKLVKKHAALAASPNLSGVRPVAQRTLPTLIRGNDGQVGHDKSKLLLRDVSRTQLMQKPVKRWVPGPYPPHQGPAPMDDDRLSQPTRSEGQMVPPHTVIPKTQRSSPKQRLDVGKSRAKRLTESDGLIPQHGHHSSIVAATASVNVKNFEVKTGSSVQPSAPSNWEIPARRSGLGRIMDLFPSLPRVGPSHHPSALKMRMEPKVTSVPVYLRRDSDVKRVPELFNYLNKRDGYGSDDDSESSGDNVEGQPKMAITRSVDTEESLKLTARPVEGDHNSSNGADIGNLQVAQDPRSRSPSPIEHNSAAESAEMMQGPQNGLNGLHAGEATQPTKVDESNGDDDGTHWCGPQGTIDDPGAWQPAPVPLTGADVARVAQHESSLPLFTHATAMTVQSDGADNNTPAPSEEQLVQTITDVSSAVFDDTRLVPISEPQDNLPYDAALHNIKGPSQDDPNVASRAESLILQSRPVSPPAGYVSPIVSIPRTSPLADAEDMAELDLSNGASDDGDPVGVDSAVVDEVDEGAGNEHEIELSQGPSGSADDEKVEDDSIAKDGNDDRENLTDDVMASSEGDADPSSPNSSGADSADDAADGTIMHEQDTMDAMETTEDEDTMVLPDRSQEASQQLIADAENAMRTGQPARTFAKVTKEMSPPAHDDTADDAVVPGSESSAFAGSDTFAVIQHFDRVVESPTLTKKKRKMTGITSKHFTPVKSPRKRRGDKDIDAQDAVSADVDVEDEPGMAASSPSLYDTPGSATTYPTKARRKAQSDASRATSYATAPETPVQPADDATLVPQTSSTAKKRRVPAGTSVCAVPPITDKYFGLLQEKLWTEPFWLLIAVTFLNKTPGRTAAPVFWALKKDYPTPESLAAIPPEALFNRIERLGLATNRTKTILSLAKTWAEFPPIRGVRYRKLHYPEHGDGKEHKPNDIIEMDSDLVVGMIEIGHLPGCGAYACDSWRIFCRDVLRGVATDFNGEGAEHEGFEPEWMRVLPLDKELRACLRWMWMREGYVWDIVTGEKRPATETEMEQAKIGEMVIDDPKEKKFAVAAAAAAGSVEQADADEVASTDEEEKAVKKKRKSKSKRIRKVMQREESLDLRASGDEVALTDEKEEEKTSRKPKTKRTRKVMQRERSVDVNASGDEVVATRSSRRSRSSE